VLLFEENFFLDAIWMKVFCKLSSPLSERTGTGIPTPFCNAAWRLPAPPWTISRPQLVLGFFDFID